MNDSTKQQASEPDTTLQQGAQRGNAASVTPLVQGLYFVASGLWPIAHLESFELVTGPKPEAWLVKTFGATIACVGGALVIGAREAPRSATLRVLGASSAAALLLCDGVYVYKRRIKPTYLLDLALEAVILAAWLRPLWAGRARSPCTRAASIARSGI